METILKASLEKVIEDWIEDNCEESSWFRSTKENVISDNLYIRMADAAEAVFISSWESQQYLKDNTECKNM